MEGLLKQTLKQYTLNLLTADLQTDAKLQCDLMHDMFSFITGISAYTPQTPYQLNTQLSSGYALSPFLAARCLSFEIRRTQKFLQGVHRSILKLLQTHETIDILYAGCGPYGTLITPLLPLFEPSQINVTLLDIHQDSLDAVQKIINEFGFEDYIKGYVKADATKYKCETKPHLVICEAMFAALRNEPQVAITLNLMPQLAKGGLFVPDNIYVDVYAIDLEKEPFNQLVKHKNGLRNESMNQSGRAFLGRIFNLRDAISVYSEWAFGFQVVKMPEKKYMSNSEKIALVTNVTIFKDDNFPVWLWNYESELTTPVFIDVPDDRYIEFWYEMSERPEFKWRKS